MGKRPVFASTFRPQYCKGFFHDIALRYAAWGFVADVVGEPVILARGVLPGAIQTAFRAELYAVVVVIEPAHLCGTHIQIWCDNKAVVRGLQRLIRGGRIRTNSPNSDLWARALQIFDHNRVRVTITHVPAHQDAEACERSRHARFNSVADRTAVVANQNRSFKLQEFHLRRVQATQRMRTISRTIQHHQLRVSKQVFHECKESTEEVLPAPELCLEEPTPAALWRTDEALPTVVCRRYSSHFITLVEALDQSCTGFGFSGWSCFHEMGFQRLAFHRFPEDNCALWTYLSRRLVEDDGRFHAYHSS